MEHDTDQAVTLRIYRAPSGQWAGRLFAGEMEIGAVAGWTVRRRSSRPRAKRACIRIISRCIRPDALHGHRPRRAGLIA
ncbi:hypothetical protein BG60_18255 [Caballeronia zhejiangensis]|uniref:Uncharacterized protein n=1 Tax=Caballeronia zhejiangensis TaxID=871203 RepID=A0A656QED5_9BURK|nr:hypothetical protein BG60_18255 [Caballeronia zhejiangensis]